MMANNTCGSPDAIGEKPEERQMLLNDPLQQQPSHQRNSRNKSKNKPKGLKNAKKVTIPGLGTSPLVPSCSIILEEGTDLAIFWNGEASVPGIKWRPSQDQNGNYPQYFSTIHDFLSTYVAGRYLRKCSMSLQPSSTKYINNLKMSDPFSTILDYRNKDGKPVTLLLAQANCDDCESGYSKFTLFIREKDGKKVLWNGSIPTNRMVAKLNQSDMSLTIENCLQNYIAKGYLCENCQVYLVKERTDIIRSRGEELNPILAKDLVDSLFKGNSASIVIRSGGGVSSGSNDNCNDNDVLQCSGKDLQDVSSCTSASSYSSWTKIPVFTSPPLEESPWVGMTWGAIKEEVRGLVNSVEITMRDMILPTETYASVADKKRTLETAIRRRSRVVDEVWRSYQALRIVHNDILSGNPRPGQVSVRRGRRVAADATGGDVDNAVQVQRSCDFLSTSLIRCGLELELYDEESQGLTRMAGVGVGIAVVVAICAVVYYY